MVYLIVLIPTSYVAVRADVQHPQACLQSCHLTLDEVYLGVPVTADVTLINQTLLAADFCWQKVRGRLTDE